MPQSAAALVPPEEREPPIRRVPAGFRLPGPRDRLAVMGRTGSGKTHFASWVLSSANWPAIPWVIVDYKHDGLLAQLPRVEEIKLADKVPKHPGLYITHPRPDEAEAVESLLWRIWERGRTGVYIDEAHILPDKGGGLQALLTQGRSKSIPMVLLTQRPVWVSRFVFSEADYYSIFHLNDKRDRQTIGSFVPIDMEKTLSNRHSYYHDVASNRTFHMLPVPDKAAILDRFDERAARTKWRKI